MPVNTISTIGEFGLIKRLARSAFVRRDVVRGIGDDTAVLPFTKDKYLLVTTDLLCAGVHFFPKENGRLVGRKALACSLSDIAAMGGVATAAVVSLGLPRHCCVRYVDDIYRGINELARKFHVSIVGGDTIHSSSVIINVAALGEVRKSQLVVRSGARKKDKIFVTGPLGCSLRTKKHLLFTPRLVEAQKLATYSKPNSMIDISDGLAADLGHILEESGKGAILDEAAIPTAKKATLENALFDGEDFELLFTVSPENANKLLHQKALKVFCIGEITGQTRKLFLRNAKGQVRALKLKGYKHF